jgi:hypothetical protein
VNWLVARSQAIKLSVCGEDLQLNADVCYVSFKKCIKQDHLDLKIMVFWKFRVTLQASAWGRGGGGFCLDFEISYLDVISERINCDSFQNLPLKTRLSYNCKSVDLDPRDALGFVAFFC